MGCCGGRKTKPVQEASVIVSDNLVLLKYVGSRTRPFYVTGGVTRVRYYVPGSDALVEVDKVGKQGVSPSDVGWFLAVDYGNAYELYVELEPEPEPEDEPEE